LKRNNALNDILIYKEILMLDRKRMMGYLMAIVSLMGVSSVHAATVASWPSEWAADSQGANNWYYMYRTSSATTTYELPWQSSSGVYGWSTDLHIGSDGGCLPNSAMTLWPVLRWKNEVAGAIQISGTVTRSATGAFSSTGTDGCIATILVNGVEKWSYNWTAVNTAAQPFDITVSGVAVDDTVDFVVNSKVNNNWGDECKWNVTVASVPVPVFSPAGPYIDGPTAVSISADEGTIYYTTDGSDPATNGLAYTDSVTVINGMTLRAVALGTGSSMETCQTYLYRVASWPSEWAEDNQGVNNWYYMYRTSSATTTYELPWESSSGVYGWSTDLHIGLNGCLPNSAMTLWPVLRWESEVAGTIQIVGSVTRVGTQAFSSTGTDGCIATILVNGVEKWSYNWTTVNTAAQTYDFTVSGVAVGDTVDFVVNPKVNNNWGDECKWNVTVVNLSAPVFSPAGPYIDGPTDVSISAEGGTIYYTSDGSDPATNGLAYTGPVTVTNGTILRAVSRGIGGVETQQTYIYRAASWPAEWAEDSQGSNNWYYQYRTSSDPDTTYELPWQSSSGVYGWSNDLHIGSDGGCLPNAAMTYWPVLRWESEVAGTIQIAGSVTRVGTQAFSSDSTDGAIATILVNGVEKWSYNWTTVNTIAQPFDITVSGVVVGDTIDFVVNSKVNNNWGDDCKWDVTIVNLPAPVFSPAGPYIDGLTAITMSAAVGATIYYTDDGSTPTTGSHKYAGSVNVSPNSTLKAIAVSGDQTWGVTSQTYVGPDSAKTVIGSVSNDGEATYVDVLAAGNAYGCNHILRGVVKYPLSSYTDSLDNAMLYAEVIRSVVGSSQTSNYFVLEHYTDSSFPLNTTDGSTTSIERIGSVQTAATDTIYSWNVKSYIEADIAADKSYSAFRLVQTDASGNYLSDASSYMVFNDDINLVVSSSSAPENLSRGHKILLKRGLQIQTWAFPSTAGYFTESNWNLSNFTTLTPHTPTDTEGDMSLLPAAPGIPWSRVIKDPAMDLTTNEIPYLSNLVSIQLDDEQNLTSSYISAITQRLASMKSKYPDVIAYTNQGWSQATPAQLQNYMQAAQPDMLMFDIYPFEPNWYGEILGGSPTMLYQYLQKYRLLGLAGNDGTGTYPVPCGLFTQTFTGEGWTHVVSESEIRLNEFSAWAFGYKCVSAFLYYLKDTNSERNLHSILFSDSGDQTPTDQFYQVAETNRQSRNLGPALVRLISTDVRMIMGKHGTSGTMNATPSGVDDDLDNIAGDSYLTSASVTAHPTGINNNQPGDVIIGFFKPLDESFDGTTYSNQKYFMVVNGLSDAAATSSATQQTIRLTFNFGSSGITSLQRLSRTTGKVETVSLTSNGTGGYYVDITLDGGTGDLFKYKTGAPFVGVVLAGDFNNDYVVNATDIDLLSAAIKTTNPDSKFDLTGEGSVNSADMDYLIKTILHTYYGDADLNGSVGVSDLSVLAAYYNTASGASWANGDFDGNGAVGVSDLSILAANYNSGSASTVSWAEAYAQAFGTTSDAETSSDEATADEEDTSSTLCSSLGLSLIAGLALMGLMIVKLEE
jgi:hypothetical protein